MAQCLYLKIVLKSEQVLIEICRSLVGRAAHYHSVFWLSNKGCCGRVELLPAGQQF